MDTILERGKIIVGTLNTHIVHHNSELTHHTKVLSICIFPRSSTGVAATRWPDLNNRVNSPYLYKNQSPTFQMKFSLMVIYRFAENGSVRPSVIGFQIQISQLTTIVAKAVCRGEGKREGKEGASGYRWGAKLFWLAGLPIALKITTTIRLFVLGFLLKPGWLRRGINRRWCNSSKGGYRFIGWWTMFTFILI